MGNLLSNRWNPDGFGALPRIYDEGNLPAAFARLLGITSLSSGKQGSDVDSTIQWMSCTPRATVAGLNAVAVAAMPRRCVGDVCCTWFRLAATCTPMLHAMDLGPGMVCVPFARPSTHLDGARVAFEELSRLVQMLVVSKNIHIT